MGNGYPERGLVCDQNLLSGRKKIPSPTRMPGRGQCQMVTGPSLSATAIALCKEGKVPGPLLGKLQAAQHCGALSVWGNAKTLGKRELHHMIPAVFWEDLGGPNGETLLVPISQIQGQCWDTSRAPPERTRFKANSSNPWPLDHTRPRIAWHETQYRFVNFLKTS